jgi:hypothetical protein
MPATIWLARGWWAILTDGEGEDADSHLVELSRSMDQYSYGD